MSVGSRTASPAGAFVLATGRGSRSCYPSGSGTRQCDSDARVFPVCRRRAQHRAPSCSSEHHTDGSSASTGPDADRALLEGWTLAVEGFHLVHESLIEELEGRFALGHGFVRALLHLNDAPDQRMPMTQLAQRAGMSSGGFTNLADRLCSCGLTARVACENDRRITYLELTGEGQATATAITAAAAEMLQSLVLAPLGRDRFDSLTEIMRDLREANNRQDPRRPGTTA
jgi:DNA-binding MarR family transcriptional regulator